MKSALGILADIDTISSLFLHDPVYVKMVVEDLQTEYSKAMKKLKVQPQHG